MSPTHTEMVAREPYPIGTKVSPQVQLLSQKAVGVTVSGATLLRERLVDSRVSPK